MGDCEGEVAPSHVEVSFSFLSECSLLILIAGVRFWFTAQGLKVVFRATKDCVNVQAHVVRGWCLTPCQSVWLSQGDTSRK